MNLLNNYSQDNLLLNLITNSLNINQFDKKNKYNNLLKKIFKSLNDTDFNLILSKYINIIKFLRFLYGDDIIDKLTENENITIIQYLLPHVNDFKLLENIKTLEEIIPNITKYKYDHQYNNKSDKDLFNDYLTSNLFLMFQTIYKTKFRLYPNFYNVIPFTIQDKENLIKNTVNYYVNNNQAIYPYTILPKCTIEDYLFKFNKYTKTDNNYILTKNLIKTAINGMMKMGILSKVITPKNIYNPDETKNKKLLKELPDYSNDYKNDKNIYYFLTGTPYSKINRYVDENDTAFLSNIGYNEWKTFDSMHWIIQIKFFHRFLNNRVLFVTGGTGTGKSSQIPKLLLYGLKAFYFKEDGQVLVSQPRIKPTEDGAVNIGKQMGVNIKTKVNGEEKYHDNIQFVHGNTKTFYNHSKRKLRLTFLTDKILLNTLIKYPLLLDKTNDEEYYNIYDIIAVDESHEHNTNMDLILSLMRIYLYYNTAIKLVIITATIEDDEEIYRKFFNFLDDNYTWPLVTKYIGEDQQEFRINGININNQLDRNIIDRRIDISLYKPKQGTNYNIKEYYMNMNDEDIKDEDKKNVIIEKILKDILKDDQTKDILIFKTGEGEINKCINYLIDKTPSDTILLPFYSSLTDSVRDFISQIDNEENRKNCKIKKDKDFKQMTSDEDFKKGSNSYKHFIIVATNIAEASITIKTLTNVIEDGLQKVNFFNYQNNCSELRKIPIADSNRIQRKGRVGRVMDGTVHYLYNKKFTEDQTMQYKITTENILLSLIDFISPLDKSKVLISYDNFHSDRDDNSIKNYLLSLRNYNNERYNDIDKKITITDTKQYYDNLTNHIKDKILTINEIGFNSSLFDDDFFIISPNIKYIEKDNFGFKIKELPEYIDIYKYIQKIYGSYGIIMYPDDNYKNFYVSTLYEKTNDIMSNLNKAYDNEIKWLIIGIIILFKLYSDKELNFYCTRLINLFFIIQYFNPMNIDIKICNIYDLERLFTQVPYNIKNNENKPYFYQEFKRKYHIDYKYYNNVYEKLDEYIKTIFSKKITENILKSTNYISNSIYDINKNNIIEFIIYYIYHNNLIKKINYMNIYVSLYNPKYNNLKVINNIYSNILKNNNYTSSYLIYCNEKIDEIDNDKKILYNVSNDTISYINLLMPVHVGMISYFKNSYITNINSKEYIGDQWNYNINYEIKNYYDTIIKLKKIDLFY